MKNREGWNSAIKITRDKGVGSSGLLADIERYGKELEIALDTLTRANKGVDKSWRKECCENVRRLRNNICVKTNELKDSS